jgi:uncharacterized protein (UPF0276 family)
VPHGIGLSLGGAERPQPARLAHLAAVARSVDAPLVSEHIAFVRADGREAGHLLPVPRTREALEILSENVAIAQAALPVPLALERFPLERIAYVHVGGGVRRDGVYHDTHAHPVVPGVLHLVEELCAITDPPGVLLERDDDFPPAGELVAEIAAIAAAVRWGAERRVAA